MIVSPAGRYFIEAREGLRLKAYRCPAGRWTIGYGHTGPDVFDGLQISQAHADDLLTHDLARFAVAVNYVCPVAGQNQFDAMASLAYNIGAEAFAGSHLADLHAHGDYEGAADEFPKWDHINNIVQAGLLLRREAEAALYRTP